MGHPIELRTNRRVDLRVVVAVHVAPHAARAVEILAAVDIDQPATLRTLDHERLILGHLREGVPVMAAVPVTQFVASMFVVHVRVPLLAAKGRGSKQGKTLLAVSGVSMLRGEQCRAIQST